MNRDPSRGWRACFVVGGLLYFVGAFFHPRASGMAAMLVDPAWIPAHAAVFVGFAVVTMGLLSFRRSVPVSPTVDRWLRITLVLAVVQIVEMGLHTMAYVDAGALPPAAFHGGSATPVLTAHVWLSTLAFTPFAVAFLGLIWTGARERVLGSPWILWLGVIGAVAYGTVMWLVFILEIDGAGVLFPVAHLAVPLWFILAGVWPAREPARVSAAAGAGAPLNAG
jgi:hypothetical protein